MTMLPLRLAGQETFTTLRGDLEILTLAGSLSTDGAHLHISVADHRGVVTATSVPAPGCGPSPSCS